MRFELTISDSKGDPREATSFILEAETSEDALNHAIPWEDVEGEDLAELLIFDDEGIRQDIYTIRKGEPEWTKFVTLQPDFFERPATPPPDISGPDLGSLDL